MSQLLRPSATTGLGGRDPTRRDDLRKLLAAPSDDERDQILTDWARAEIEPVATLADAEFSFQEITINGQELDLSSHDDWDWQEDDEIAEEMATDEAI